MVRRGSVDRYLKEYAMNTGTPAPDFTLTALDGKKIILSELKGKFVFLDFWGSWCSPCVQEIPNVKQLHADIPDEDLIVIGIVCHDKEETIKDFIEKNDIRYPNAMADSDILNTYGVAKFPTTFLIDREGKIVAKDIRGELTNLVQKKME
jgi:peroxiredoxin